MWAQGRRPWHGVDTPDPAALGLRGLLNGFDTLVWPLFTWY